MEKITGNIELKTQIAKVTLQGVYDRHGIAAEIFSVLGQHGFNVEAITTTQYGKNRADISFAVPEQHLPIITRVLQSNRKRFGTKKITADKGLALIAIYGSKHLAIPGAAAAIFSRFSDLGVNIEMISSSLSSLTVVIKKEKAQGIIEALKKDL